MRIRASAVAGRIMLIGEMHVFLEALGAPFYVLIL